MIHKLVLRNFKCFSNETVPLNRLTMLSGTNGGGKSTIVQSLLLLQAASELDAAPCYLPLNGPHALELGSVSDVVSQSNISDEICIGIEFDRDKKLFLNAQAGSSTAEDRFLTLSLSGSLLKEAFPIREGFDFIYLAADRIGPRDTYPTQSRPFTRASLGPRGEFAAEVLAHCERTPIRETLASPTSESSSAMLVRTQLELWMRQWVPDLQIRAETYAGTNLSILRYCRANLQSEWMRPTNLGFGISHSMPIVLAGLVVNSHGTLIVDSPESHLHPAGQSAIGRFLASVAASGVQVIIETHSDHLLNGIRLSIKKGQLKHTDVNVLFLTRAEAGTHEIAVRTPDQNGKIADWPSGFFDQAEKDLLELI